MLGALASFGTTMLNTRLIDYNSMIDAANQQFWSLPCKTKD